MHDFGISWMLSMYIMNLMLHMVFADVKYIYIYIPGHRRCLGRGGTRA